MSDLAGDLARLSSAEDFLTYFGVAADPHVVAVNRLHILKRLNQYLAREEGFDAKDDETKRTLYRKWLTKACEDFASSSAQREKVFPVFRRGEGGFVSLASVRPIERK
jgi:nitrogenase-stabilizing/protective protein